MDVVQTHKKNTTVSSREKDILYCTDLRLTCLLIGFSIWGYINSIVCQILSAPRWLFFMLICTS